MLKLLERVWDSEDNDICDIPVINVKVELGSQRVPSMSVAVTTLFLTLGSCSSSRVQRVNPGQDAPIDMIISDESGANSKSLGMYTNRRRKELDATAQGAIVGPVGMGWRPKWLPCQ